MSAIPGLKKKLKSVRATGKLSKAMKTVSAAKFSKLASFWKTYSLYTEQYRFLYRDFEDTGKGGQTADTVIVMGSNRGFCGGFNNEIVNYFTKFMQENSRPGHLIVCGEELISMLSGSGFAPEHQFVFGDVPSYAECEPLFALLSDLSGAEKNYRIRVIYPSYRNTMIQIPKSELLTLNPDVSVGDSDGVLWVPDKKTVLEDTVEKSFRALLFRAVLETALGAQAATLMTMRSAYDTASEYSENLESEIHRLRQSEVTADVIETSSERFNKGDETNG